MQLYVRDVESTVIRPDRELKAFAKVALEAGESKIVHFTLNKRSFAYYNVDMKDWHVETGRSKFSSAALRGIFVCRLG